MTTPEKIIANGDACVQVYVDPADPCEGVWLHDGQDAIQVEIEEGPAWADAPILVWLWQQKTRTTPGGRTYVDHSPDSFVRCSGEDLRRFAAELVNVADRAEGE